MLNLRWKREEETQEPPREEETQEPPTPRRTIGSVWTGQWAERGSTGLRACHAALHYDKERQGTKVKVHSYL